MTDNPIRYEDCTDEEKRLWNWANRALADTADQRGTSTGSTQDHDLAERMHLDADLNEAADSSNNDR